MAKAKRRRSTRRRPAKPPTRKLRSKAPAELTTKLREIDERGAAYRAQFDQAWLKQGREEIDRILAIRDGLLPPLWVTKQSTPEPQPEPQPAVTRKRPAVDPAAVLLKQHPEWLTLRQGKLLTELKKQGLNLSPRSLQRTLKQVKS
jgi:hypothetical protein